jgi:hypothetical protein
MQICVLGSDREGEGMAPGRKSDGNGCHFDMSNGQWGVIRKKVLLQEELAE